MPTALKWFDTTAKKAGGLLALLTLATAVFAVWAAYEARNDARYFSASSGQRIENKVDVMLIELKVGQALGRRQALQTEIRLLQVAPTRTALEAGRLAAVEIELRDVEKEIDRLREMQGRLPR